MKNLSRIEYIGLTNLSQGFMSGLNVEMLDKFVMYGLVNAIKEQRNACRYVITIAGEKYIKEHLMPELKINESQALILAHQLGDVEYECAPPINHDSASFKLLIRLQALEVVKRADGLIEGYNLTDEGKAAFERTDVGAAYLKRLELLKLREKVDLKFSESKIAKSDKPQAVKLKEHAKIAHRMKALDYEKEILLKIEKIEKKQTFLDLIAQIGLTISDVYFNDADQVIPYQINITGTGTKITVTRNNWSNRSGEPKLLPFWYVYSNVYVGSRPNRNYNHPVGNFDGWKESSIKDAEVMASGFTKAIEICNFLNENIKFEEIVMETEADE